MCQTISRKWPVALIGDAIVMTLPDKGFSAEYRMTLNLMITTSLYTPFVVIFLQEQVYENNYF